ncbi:hypothetical protein C7M61_004131 [Candidozyma pseudohaemuli]|uniref:N-acetyltransferase domain-containing protein n=1 Tax=Candidozyma pseudohaemuli TaxID=418784 RepID=A0A2P7YK10_9ASCO|nr:hypothetical protein C7M61_004131 [[Candida] pseudohaemulonii]PSK36307.1 hypothetical protein C7M61_004131 [[Candida] pseudohaemulonii]
MSSNFEFLKTLPFADRKYETTPKITDSCTFNLAKDGRTVTLFPAYSSQEIPAALFEILHEEFNYVIEEGQTYPHYLPMSPEEFEAYLFEGMAAILVNGEFNKDDFDQPKSFWEEKYLGHFYIKPNYIGRCSHVCNAGFIVNHFVRGLGLGKEMGRKFLDWAPRLGYVYSVFNLVFETNIASKKIWDSLGFEQIGYIKNVAVLKGHDRLIGAYMYGRDLI